MKKEFVCVDRYEYQIDPWHANFLIIFADNRNEAKRQYSVFYKSDYIDVRCVLAENKHLLNPPAF